MYDKKRTAMTVLYNKLVTINEAVEMTDEVELVVETLMEAIKDHYLPMEKQNMKSSFDAGEMNYHNHQRDEMFEFEDYEDYFNKLFTQKTLI
jgi:hypothetical protein